MKYFPVLRGHDSTWNSCPRLFPWALIAGHEAQALKNHEQTLARLAQRGGLGPDELMAVLEDRPWHPMDPVEAIEQVKEYLNEHLVCVSCQEPFQRPVGSVLEFLDGTYYMCIKCTQEMQSRED